MKDEDLKNSVLENDELEISFDADPGATVELQDEDEGKTNEFAKTNETLPDTDSDDPRENPVIGNEKRRLERKRYEQNKKKKYNDAVNKVNQLQIEHDFKDQQIQKLSQDVELLKGLATQYQNGNLDKQIQETEAAINYWKKEYAGAVSVGDGDKAAATNESFNNAILQMHQLKNARQQMSVQQPNSQQASPYSVNNTKMKRHYAEFMSEHDWINDDKFKSEAQIVTAIDNQIAAEGYDPNTPAYWNALRNKVKNALPEMFDYEQAQPVQKKNVVGGSSTMSSSSGSPGTRKLHFTPFQWETLKREGFVSDDNKVLNRAKVEARHTAYNKDKKGIQQ